MFEESHQSETKRVLYTGDFWSVSKPVDTLFTKQIDLLIMECDRYSGLAGPSVGGGHMSITEAIRLLKDGVFSNPKPKQVIFVHFGDHGPCGSGSTYQDWRNSIINVLTEQGLANIIPNQDIVIGYEGLMITL